MVLAVTGCNFAHLSQLGAGSGGAALVTSLVTSNPAYIASSAAIGAVSVEVLDPLGVKDPSVAEVLSELPEEDRAEVLIAKEKASIWTNSIMYLIIGGVVLIIVAWILPGPQLMFRKKKKVGQQDLFK